MRWESTLARTCPSASTSIVDRASVARSRFGEEPQAWLATLGNVIVSPFEDSAAVFADEQFASVKYAACEATFPNVRTNSVI